MPIDGMMFGVAGYWGEHEGVYIPVTPGPPPTFALFGDDPIQHGVIGVQGQWLTENMDLRAEYYFQKEGGNTDTHFIPQTFSFKNVAGRQLIRSCVSSLKICTIFSGNNTSPAAYAFIASSAASIASRMSKHPAPSKSSCEK